MLKRPPPDENEGCVDNRKCSLRNSIKIEREERSESNEALLNSKHSEILPDHSSPSHTEHPKASVRECDYDLLMPAGIQAAVAALREDYESNAIQLQVTFPEKLMDMIDELDEQGNTSIAWLPDGRSFSINSQSELEREILPRYFPTCKFRSFLRKLYRWGFHQVSSNKRVKKRCIYEHECFERGKKSLCLKMKSDMNREAKPKPRKKPPTSLPLHGRRDPKNMIKYLPRPPIVLEKLVNTGALPESTFSASVPPKTGSTHNDTKKAYGVVVDKQTDLVENSMIGAMKEYQEDLQCTHPLVLKSTSETETKSMFASGVDLYSNDTACIPFHSDIPTRQNHDFLDILSKHSMHAFDADRYSNNTTCILFHSDIPIRQNHDLLDILSRPPNLDTSIGSSIEELVQDLLVNSSRKSCGQIKNQNRFPDGTDFQKLPASILNNQFHHNQNNGSINAAAALTTYLSNKFDTTQHCAHMRHLQQEIYPLIASSPAIPFSSPRPSLHQADEDRINIHDFNNQNHHTSQLLKLYWQDILVSDIFKFMGVRSSIQNQSMAYHPSLRQHGLTASSLRSIPTSPSETWTQPQGLKNDTSSGEYNLVLRDLKVDSPPSSYASLLYQENINSNRKPASALLSLVSSSHNQSRQTHKELSKISLPMDPVLPQRQISNITSPFTLKRKRCPSSSSGETKPSL